MRMPDSVQRSRFSATQSQFRRLIPSNDQLEVLLQTSPEPEQVAHERRQASNPYLPFEPIAAHAFSRDGLHWTLSPTRAYGTIVQTTSGGAVQYSRRERPHLVLDASRSPTHLLSAVGGAPAGTTDVWTLPRDFSFTHVQALRRQDAASP